MATEGLGIGGAEVVIQRLAETLDRDRFNITICCLKVMGSIGETLQRSGLEVAVLTDPLAKKVNYLTFREMLKLIRARKIDVVHTHTMDALADAALCKIFRPGVKLIHTFHFGNYPHRKPRDLWIERIFSRFATRLYAVGEVQRNQLKSVLRVGDQSIGRVWNGVSFAAFRSGRCAKRRRREARRPQIVIGTLATLTEQKGLFDLLAVAKKVRAQRDHVRFVIIGDGPLRPRLEAARKELGLEDTVTLAGWVHYAAHVALPDVDVFFQPSLWEAMSIALLEGMAAGKAIVATRVGETSACHRARRRWPDHRKQDVDGMTAALLRLIDDSELRARLSAAAPQGGAPVHRRAHDAGLRKNLFERREEPMTVDARTREQPKKVLQSMEVHSKWITHFRGSENTPFYNLAFNHLAKLRPAGRPAHRRRGRGTGTKSMHLAKRGYRVLGLDISESVVVQARAAAVEAGFGQTVEFRRADLTEIPLQTAQRHRRGVLGRADARSAHRKGRRRARANHRARRRSRHQRGQQAFRAVDPLRC